MYCTGKLLLSLPSYLDSETGSNYCIGCIHHAPNILNLVETNNNNNNQKVCECNKCKYGARSITTQICPCCFVMAGCNFDTIDSVNKKINKHNVCITCQQPTNNNACCIQCAVTNAVCSNCNTPFVDGNGFIDLIKQHINQPYRPSLANLLTMHTNNLHNFTPLLQNKTRQQIVAMSLFRHYFIKN
jgi:hypothetical protein